MSYKIFPLSEFAVLIDVSNERHVPIGINKEVQRICNQILEFPFRGFVELVPAFNTITVYYDPSLINVHDPISEVINWIDKILSTPYSQSKINKKYIEIPVCYENKYALDLPEIANRNNLTINEAIRLHSNVVYEVVFIGFSPGFPFLAGLDERLHFPRKETPRLKVDHGSVGIAGTQTGIYPMDSPGGWQIIGRTPMKLFDIKNPEPTLLLPGDKVKFYPITEKEYVHWEEKPWV